MKALSRLVTIVVLGISGVNALALELPLPFDTELGRLYRNEIDSLLVPADRLPPECHLAHEMTAVIGQEHRIVRRHVDAVGPRILPLAP